MCSVPVILVGNKNDLDAERVISEEEGHRLADSWKTVYVEASAKQPEVNTNKKKLVDINYI